MGSVGFLAVCWLTWTALILLGGWRVLLGLVLLVQVLVIAGSLRSEAEVRCGEYRWRVSGIRKSVEMMWAPGRGVSRFEVAAGWTRRLDDRNDVCPRAEDRASRRGARSGVGAEDRNDVRFPEMM